jgi:hypothetical protein
MKKFKKQNHTKVALFAGATALMALTQNSHAQSSVDALLNKLEQKGVLTVDEAKELKAENATNSVYDFNTEMSSKFPMPDWVTGYKLSGDFRGRVDDQTGSNPAFVDRTRFRYRLRAGLTVSMKDNLEVGFRIGSSDPASNTYNGSGGGSPLSNNSTIQDDFSKKPLYIDAAYGRWTPVNDGTWMLAGTFGKMDNPFMLTPMVFDPDLTPEGAAAQTSYKFNDNQSVSFNGGAFVLDEEKTSASDPVMYGAQLIWNAKWTSKIASALGVAAFDIVNDNQLIANGTAGQTVPYINQGNTRNAAGVLTYNYNPVIADASATYTLDSFPLYAGAFPVKLAGEYMNNPAAPANNEGFWGGVMLGKSGKKGAWDLAYRYEYLEADAWYDQLVDDDNGAFYQNAVASRSVSGGWFGGTNVKGHLIKLNYSLTDSLTFTATCFINDLINQNINGTAEPKSYAIHTMVDLMWKF